MLIVPLINVLFVQVGAQWFTVLTELLAMFDHHHLTALSTEYGSSYLCSVNRFRSVVSHNSFCTLHSTIIICPATLVFTLSSVQLLSAYLAGFLLHLLLLSGE